MKNRFLGPQNSPSFKPIEKCMSISNTILNFFNFYWYVSVSMIVYSFLIWAIKKMSPEVIIKNLSLQFSKTKLIIKNILSMLETTYWGRVNYLITLDSGDSVKWKREGNESLLWSILKCSKINEVLLTPACPTVRCQRKDIYLFPILYLHPRSNSISQTQ